MKLEKQEAIDFFAEFFGGEHHIPNGLKEWGSGWCVNSGRSDLATYDFNGLTRLVFMAHDKCIRVEIKPSGPGMIKICLHKRQREGGFSKEHPTLETAVSNWREKNQTPTT